MLNKLFNSDEFKLDMGDKSPAPKLERISKRDIAIIGMYGKFPMAGDLEEFWQNLKDGKDCIREFPGERLKDSKPVLPNSFMPANPARLCEAGYLDEIDRFDYEFFNLSPGEARLMDPNQRMFLQAAWGAIDDAGYGGKRISGSKTGVYVGHSSDLRFEYHMYVNAANPDLYGHISLPGNVKSIIASRIAYLLDLKGPSLVVDTACSSALVAVHLACQGIINGECEMAVAGGIKINMLPVQKGMSDEIGIRSPGDRARTFDDSSDGTGSGEGVAAIMLKSLGKAVTDGDHIYAVIKGSAVNQDGSSVGLTAPNSAAQEEVILEAWKNAGIDPETITYIEAHGTATKLGDPIEVSGMERAFKKHTGRKGFCAVGSVKTNIGHLDNVAGMAGLIKLVLALKNKEIPASIHFKRPNRKINFIDSPVYVNDKLAKWETEGLPLRGGVSSFGLAGTNCHVVVEEYKEKEGKAGTGVQYGMHILALSARDRDTLIELADKYKQYLKKTEIPIEDICHTAATGRLHLKHRLGILAGTREELLQKLESFNAEDIVQSGFYYGEHRIVSESRKAESENDITEDARRELDILARRNIESISQTGDNREACLNEICRLYVKGAEIDWDLLYKGQRRKKASLPLYPFKRSRCWVEPIPGKANTFSREAKEIAHPLIDRCVVKTVGQEIYSVKFSPDTHWVLGEHKVAGRCVIPGTAYLEMIRQIYSKHLGHKFLELETVLFILPFTAEPGETKEMQIIVHERDGYCGFTIASQHQAGLDWNIHVEGKVRAVSVKDIPSYDISGIMQDASMQEIIEDAGRKIIVETGPRWTDVKKRLYGGRNGKYLAYFEMSDHYGEDFKEYYLHPSLMDRSINAVNRLIGEGGYLPLSYKSMIVYGPTPKEFYSYLRRHDAEKGTGETASFDISLIDKSGKVFAEIKDYVIKKVREDEFKFRRLKESKNIFHKVGWKPDPIGGGAKDLIGGDILVFKGSSEFSGRLVKALRAQGCSIIEVESGHEFARIRDDCYTVNGGADYYRLLDELKGRRLTHILHLATLSGDGGEEVFEELEARQKTGVYSLFHLVRALVGRKFNKEMELVLISDYAEEVTGSERKINPHNGALFGLGKVVSQEYSNIKCRCIDIDEGTLEDNIIAELKSGGNASQTAYRQSLRYINEFQKYNIAKEHSIKLEIKEQGAYIITGGTGGLGLEVGKHLAKKARARIARAKIALIGRSSMPDREKWDGILEADVDSKTCRAIRAVLEMQKHGAEVVCLSADVSELDEMKTVVDGLRDRFGSINGVIHCAGVAGDGFIIRKEESAFHSVLAPKILGTWILDKLTEKDNLDFFVMFSSITAVLGGQGQGDYTAANSYMDSFADYRNKSGKRTISINWAAWKDTGMAVDYRVDELENTLKPLPTDIAMMAFDEALSRQIHRVVIGELNYDVFSAFEGQFPISIAHDVQLIIDEHDSTIKTDIAPPGENKARDILIKGCSDEVFGATERKVAGIWAEILGLDEVNIYDSFNSMGGDSILATRLLRRLENEYPGMIDIADVFAYSTVSAMAEYIDSALRKQEVPGTGEVVKEATQPVDDVGLDELLEKLAKGEISADEAEKYY